MATITNNNIGGESVSARGASSIANERHQDALLHELRQEVMELRAKQGDIAGLQDQLTYLTNKFNTTQGEKNRSD